MVAQEGAAHFYLGVQATNFVISCWFSGRKKNKQTNKKLSPNENPPKSFWLPYTV